MKRSNNFSDIADYCSQDLSEEECTYMLLNLVKKKQKSNDSEIFESLVNFINMNSLVYKLDEKSRVPFGVFINDFNNFSDKYSEIQQDAIYDIDFFNSMMQKLNLFCEKIDGEICIIGLAKSINVVENVVESQMQSSTRSHMQLSQTQNEVIDDQIVMMETDDEDINLEVDEIKNLDVANVAKNEVNRVDVIYEVDKAKRDVVVENVEKVTENAEKLKDVDVVNIEKVTGNAIKVEKSKDDVMVIAKKVAVCDKVIEDKVIKPIVTVKNQGNLVEGVVEREVEGGEGVEGEGIETQKDKKVIISMENFETLKSKFSAIKEMTTTLRHKCASQEAEILKLKKMCNSYIKNNEEQTLKLADYLSKNSNLSAENLKLSFKIAQQSKIIDDFNMEQSKK